MSTERQVIEDPPPLNAVRDFPYRIAPFPDDWLRQFAGLDAALSTEEEQEQPTTEKIEQWN